MSLSGPIHLFLNPEPKRSKATVDSILPPSTAVVTYECRWNYGTVMLNLLASGSFQAKDGDLCHILQPTAAQDYAEEIHSRKRIFMSISLMKEHREV